MLASEPTLEVSNMNELTHHGVMGMKWGVRRYQNIDGSLTRAGRLHFRQVRADAKQRQQDTKQAVQMLNKTAKSHDRQAFLYNKRAAIRKKQADSLSNAAAKASTKGKTAKSEKLALRSTIAKEIHADYKHTANVYLARSGALKQKASDISAGKLQAGRDFIVQRDLNFSIKKLSVAGVPVRLPIVKEDRTLVERR